MKTNTKSGANKKKKDSIDKKPQKRSRITASRQGTGSRSTNQSERYVSEYSGLERTYDEYDRYEDIFDANASEYLVNQDASIILSEITITDTQGRNRTLARAQQR
ncbi:MAG TPA: hypothetical protein VE130_08340 [Nitrososphaeraceae archaeon]|nr:hypothetical protein [Nitrososphaeraceae archaeon]